MLGKARNSGLLPSGKSKAGSPLHANFRPLSIREEGTLHPARPRRDGLRAHRLSCCEDISSRRRLNAARKGGSSPVHRFPGDFACKKALESPKSVPKLRLRPPNRGRWPTRNAIQGFRTGQPQTMLLNRRTDPCVTLIFRRFIVRPSASTVSSRSSTRSRSPRAARLLIRPITSSAPARIPTGSRWRSPASPTRISRSKPTAMS